MSDWGFLGENSLLISRTEQTRGPWDVANLLVSYSLFLFYFPVPNLHDTQCLGAMRHRSRFIVSPLFHSSIFPACVFLLFFVFMYGGPILAVGPVPICRVHRGHPDRVLRLPILFSFLFRNYSSPVRCGSSSIHQLCSHVDTALALASNVVPFPDIRFT